VEKTPGHQGGLLCLTNFNGFAKMIDILGGVTIDVENVCINPQKIKPEARRTTLKAEMPWLMFVSGMMPWRYRKNRTQQNS
jgi:hypothetical protein